MKHVRARNLNDIVARYFGKYIEIRMFLNAKCAQNLKFEKY